MERSAALQASAQAGAGAAVVTAWVKTAPSREPMQMPSATSMQAVATWLAVSEPMANGAAAPHTVATATIHHKNVRGRGVANGSAWANPVAASAARKAVSA